MTHIEQLRMLRGGAEQAPHGNGATRPSRRRRSSIILGLSVCVGRRRVDDVLRAVTVDLQNMPVTSVLLLLLLLPLPLAFVSMLVPPFSFTSSS